MALTRKFLAGLGLEENVISAIIEAHTETTDALKEQRDTYKADAEKLPEIQRQFKELQEKEGSDEWKEKYEKEHSDFEAFKADQKEKETAALKEKEYRELLRKAGVAEKRINSIMKLTAIKDLELDKDGKLKDVEGLTKNIQEEWSEFITTTEEKGAETKTPPTAGGAAVTKEQFDKMGYNERLKLYNEDRQTYDHLVGQSQ